jgi:uncharacterized protein (DUF608 family)
MGIPISLKEVAQKLDSLFDEMTAYINRETGELHTVSGEDARLIEDEEEDLPEWQKESIAKAKEVLNNDAWVTLPGKFEIHEWEIMRDFAESVTDEELSESLLQAIQGKGAFRYFKDTLNRHNIQDDWYRFKLQALEKIAADALVEADIPYKK